MMMKFSKGNRDGIVVEDKRVPSKLGKISKKWSKEASLGKSLMQYVKGTLKDGKKPEGCVAGRGRACQGEQLVQRP